MYFGFGALNFCTPIFLTALAAKSQRVSNRLSFTNDFLWMFTVAVLFVALSIIKRTLKAESRVAVNVQAMSVHLFAFAIYAAQTLWIVIIDMKFQKNPTIKNEVKYLDATIAGIVIQCVSSSILMTIFVKIYMVVRDKDLNNA
jgi:hypothetical protein